MKIFLDFLPILLFFGAFKYGESNRDWAASFATEHLGFMVSGGVVGTSEAPALLATVVIVIAMFALISILKLQRKKIDLMMWVSFALVTILGSLTVWFHSETFIKWKPSALYWIMGMTFWVSQKFFQKNLLQTLMGEQLKLPDFVWERLNVAWVAFFGLMGVLNLYVAYSFSTSTWVNFKLFGGIGIMLVFTLAQGVYLSRYLKEPDSPAAIAPESKP